jgi:hypothetical protein
MRPPQPTWLPRCGWLIRSSAHGDSGAPASIPAPPCEAGEANNCPTLPRIAVLPNSRPLRRGASSERRPKCSENRHSINLAPLPAPLSRAPTWPRASGQTLLASAITPWKADSYGTACPSPSRVGALGWPRTCAPGGVAGVRVRGGSRAATGAGGGAPRNAHETTWPCLVGTARSCRSELGWKSALDLPSSDARDYSRSRRECKRKD